MKIIDKNNQVIENPDLTKGRLEPDRLFVAHHDTIPAVEEQWHHETVAVYPNGGKDVIRVIDVPAQEAKAAWDEYEEVQRYIEYTPEEIKKMNEPPPEEQLAQLQEEGLSRDLALAELAAEIEQLRGGAK